MCGSSNSLFKLFDIGGEADTELVSGIHQRGLKLFIIILRPFVGDSAVYRLLSFDCVDKIDVKYLFVAPDSLLFLKLLCFKGVHGDFESALILLPLHSSDYIIPM